jgi:hypothetical protein
MMGIGWRWRMAATFQVGDRVRDRDGHVGTVTKVTNWKGSVWYDVRFGRSGSAVRYDNDLIFAKEG